jgi:hypothetical protein
MLSLALAALLHFRDVPTDSWAFPDVTMLASAGVLHGESSGLFEPGSPVSRQQAAATLARALALPAATLPPMRDSRDLSPTLRPDVARAVQAGILRGTTAGYLEPTQPLNRAAAAALIARAFKIAPQPGALVFEDKAAIPAYAAGDIAALSADGIVLGDVEGDFLPLARVTRAEWAAMLLRAIAYDHGAAGVRNIVAGSLADVYPPDDPALAAASPLGGGAGAIGVAGRTLDLMQAALVYRGSSGADLFALHAGDLVAAFVAKDGSSPLLLDLAPAAAQPLQGEVADLSPGTLYLDSGTELPIGQGATITYGGRSVAVQAWPSYLLWSQVTAQEDPLTLTVTGPYAFDLAGTIASVDQNGFTLRLDAASALSPLLPSLGAGDLVTIKVDGSTTVAGLGASPPSLPAVGLSAVVQGRVETDGSVAADQVALSQ